MRTTTSPRFQKDPSATRDFSVTWEDSEIVAGGATLSSLSVSASPAGLTVGATGVSGAIGTVRLSGGALGTTYEVAFSATFSNGEIDVQRILVTIREIPVGLP
jgi:hypothetical protein